MKRVIKNIFKLLLGLSLAGVFVLLLLVLLLPYILERQAVSQLIAEQIESALGRKVQFDGSLHLTLDATPVVSLDAFAIENAAGFPHGKMLAIGKLLVSAPLHQDPRKRPLRIESIEGDDIELLFLSDEKGRTNWDFPKTSKSKTKSSTAKAVSLPNIERISLQNVRASFQSHDAHHKVHIEKLLIRKLGPSQSASFEVQAKVDGKEIIFQGKMNPLSLAEDTTWWLRDLSVKLLGAQIQGDVEFASASSLLTTKLSVDDIDIPSIKAAFAEDPAAQETTPQEHPTPFASLAASPATPFVFPFDALAAFPFSLDVKLKKVSLSPTHYLEDIILQTENNADGLHIAQFSTTTLGGHVALKAKLSRSQSELALQAEKLQFNPLTKLADGEQIIDGLFNIDLDVKTSGETFDALIQNSEGKFLLTSEHAKLTSSTVQAASAGLFSILSPLFKKNSDVPLPCLLYDFTIAQGKAKSNAQVIRISDVFFFGKGTLDFTQMSVNNNFSVQSASPSLASLIPPFRVHGKLAQPQFVPSISASIASLTDSAESALLSPLALATRTAEILGAAKSAEGLESCKEALENEKNLLSSQIGRLLE